MWLHSTSKSSETIANYFMTPSVSEPIAAPHEDTGLEALASTPTYAGCTLCHMGGQDRSKKGPSLKPQRLVHRHEDKPMRLLRKRQETA